MPSGVSWCLTVHCPAENSRTLSHMLTDYKTNTDGSLTALYPACFASPLQIHLWGSVGASIITSPVAAESMRHLHRSIQSDQCLMEKLIHPIISWLSLSVQTEGGQSLNTQNIHKKRERRSWFLFSDHLLINNITCSYVFISQHRVWMILTAVTNTESYVTK